MKDNIPKIALNEHFEMNAISMQEVEMAKKRFNKMAMQDDYQANALLQIEIERLKMALEEKIEECEKLESENNNLKEKNETLKSKMVEFNQMVDDHLKKVVKRLNETEQHNHTFLEKIVNAILLRKCIRKTEELQYEAEKH